ncbi:STAS domain-containing protein [Sphaerisporangium fuscum]|uniref:STAS domain-containing protein n=1 Tax=Sphaerisporangium fuscum TaxID=2835868 RepID=UPI0027E39A3D|nr:STAS domain-containing protein [Sphaerisporangium fuscum]
MRHDLTVSVDPHPAGPCLVLVTGDLDHHTTPRLNAVVKEVPLESGGGLVIDLSGMTFCDSTGIAALVAAYQLAQDAGARLALAGVDSHILRIFRIMGLNQIFSVYDSVDDAVRVLCA